MVKLMNDAEPCYQCAHYPYCYYRKHITTMMHALQEVAPETPEIQLKVDSCEEYEEENESQIAPAV